MSHTLTTKLADYFKERPYCWIDGRILAEVAGAYAWRTRVSDLRKPKRLGGKYEMAIENRVETYRTAEGKPFKLSSYRYLPARAAQESVA